MTVTPENRNPAGGPGFDETQTQGDGLHRQAITRRCAACDAAADSWRGQWQPFPNAPYFVAYALCIACAGTLNAGGATAQRVTRSIESGLIERIPRLRAAVEAIPTAGGVQ